MGGRSSTLSLPDPPPLPEDPKCVRCRIVGAYFWKDGGCTVYQIQVAYRGFEWSLRKRYSQMKRLHGAVRSATPAYRPTGLEALPKAPWFTSKTKPTLVAERVAHLQHFLAHLVSTEQAWVNASAAMCEFFEVSPGISFHRALSGLRKGKEGWLWKETGGRFTMSKPLFTTSKWRWFAVKDCGLAWYRRTHHKYRAEYFGIIPDSTEMLDESDGLAANSGVELELRGVLEADDALCLRGRYGERNFTLSNRSRSMVLWAPDAMSLGTWIVALQQAYGLHNIVQRKSTLHVLPNGLRVPAPDSTTADMFVLARTAPNVPHSPAAVAAMQSVGLPPPAHAALGHTFTPRGQSQAPAVFSHAHAEFNFMDCLHPDMAHRLHLHCSQAESVADRSLLPAPSMAQQGVPLPSPSSPAAHEQAPFAAMQGGSGRMVSAATALAHSVQRQPEMQPPRHMHGSFAPLRLGCPLTPLLNGREYFAALAAALMCARREIFLAGWWIIPEYPLIRQVLADPGAPAVQLSLLDIIRERALAGVNIYVLLYKEVPSALPKNKSNAAKLRLERLFRASHPASRRIHVMRHPDHYTLGHGSLFWSHHDKVAVVDQRVAFVGGIDIATGRFDDCAHGMGSTQAQQGDWPAAAPPPVASYDVNNPMMDAATALDSGDARQASRERASCPRGAFCPPLPWRVPERKEHGAEQPGEWTAGSVCSLTSPALAPFLPAAQQSAAVGGAGSPEEGGGGPPGASDDSAEGPLPSTPDDFVKLFDPTAMRMSAVGGSAVPGGVVAERQPVGGEDEWHIRMPWHDVAVAVGGQTAIDVGFAFVQRWNHHLFAKGKTTVLPPLLPATDIGSWWAEPPPPIPMPREGGDLPSHAQRLVTKAASIHRMFKRIQGAGTLVATLPAWALPLPGHDAQAGRVGGNAGLAEGVGTDAASFVSTTQADGSTVKPHPLVMSPWFAAPQGETGGTSAAPQELDADPTDAEAHNEDTASDTEGEGGIAFAVASAAAREEGRPATSAAVEGESAGPQAPPPCALPGDDADDAASLAPSHAASSSVYSVAAADSTDSDTFSVAPTEGGLPTGVGDPAAPPPSNMPRPAMEAAVAHELPSAFASTFGQYLSPELLAGQAGGGDAPRPPVLAQALRSASSWSYGLPLTESSVHTAVCDMIQASRKYVYIENQFFISSTGVKPADGAGKSGMPNPPIDAAGRLQPSEGMGLQPSTQVPYGGTGETSPDHRLPISPEAGSSSVMGLLGSSMASGLWSRDRRHNRIAEVLVRRILRAVFEGDVDFRVYLLVPHHPDGCPYTTRAVQAVLHHQLSTLCRDTPHVASILGALAHHAPLAFKAGPGASGGTFPDLHTLVSRHISFTSVRAVAPRGDRLVSEQIYIHSKVFLVDDRVGVVGSANVNDRSMKGDRDSEFACLFSSLPPQMWSAEAQAAMGGAVQDTAVPGSAVASVGGSPWVCCPHVRSLRCRLWAEHLGWEGVLPDAVRKVAAFDPCSQRWWSDVWVGSASANARWYMATFPGLRHMYHRAWNLMHRASEPREPREWLPEEAAVLDALVAAAGQSEVAWCQLRRLVLYPTGLLQEFDLRPSMTTGEGIVPDPVFQ